MRPDESQLTACRTIYLILHLLPSFMSLRTAATGLSVIKAPPQYSATTSIHVCMQVSERERGQTFNVAYSMYIFFFKGTTVVDHLHGAF